MQNADASEGVCNRCGYAWTGGYPETLAVLLFHLATQGWGVLLTNDRGDGLWAVTIDKGWRLSDPNYVAVSPWLLEAVRKVARLGGVPC